jgi:DnaJ-class molecular chaperone
MKDTILYEKIGLDCNLSNEDIKKEGKKLLLKYHPDKNENKEESSKKFIEIKEILDILTNTEKRELYHNIGISILNYEDYKEDTYNKEKREDNRKNYKNNYDLKEFNNVFENFTKIINNKNIKNTYELKFDSDINYKVKVDLSIIDPYIPVLINVVYRRYNYNLYSEEDKKVIITITAEKLLDIIEKNQKIVMEGHGNILKDKKTDLIIIIEEIDDKK